MGSSRVVAAVVLVGLFAASCDHDGDEDAASPAPVDDTLPVATTTTTVANRPPRLTDEVDGNDGGYRRREDVDEVVRNENCAQRPVRIAGEALQPNTTTALRRGS